MKYFLNTQTFEENRTLHRDLTKRYHPDSPTGNQDMMQEINAEWKLYQDNQKEQVAESDLEENEVDYISYMGVRYEGDPNDICQLVALRFGGMALQEFMSGKEYEDYCDKYDTIK